MTPTSCTTTCGKLEPLANLGKAMRQLQVPNVSCCAQVLQVRALVLRDTFHGQHCHGLHALPITVLGEHVGLEVGDEGLEVGEHPLGGCPSTYATHAIITFLTAISKRAMFKYAMRKTQTSSCRLFNLPDKADLSNKLQLTLPINSVDSENRPACLPIIASVELTKPSWNVLQQNGRFSIK
jgi:hypothetical protein